MGSLMQAEPRMADTALQIDTCAHPTLTLLPSTHSPVHALPVCLLLCPIGVEANFGHVTSFNVTTDAKLMRFLRRYRVTFTVIDFLDDDDEVGSLILLSSPCLGVTLFAGGCL